MQDKKQKLLEIKTNKLVDSLFVGNYKTNIKGNGIEFIDYKEYDYSDNVKNIDFLRSEKEGKTLVKLFEEERDLSVYFILDLNNTFFSNYSSIKKIDIVYEIFYLIGLSTIKQGDKFGLYVFDSNNKRLSFAKKGKQNFVDLLKIIDEFSNYNSRNNSSKHTFNKIDNNTNNNKSGLSYFNSLKIKKSVVFHITDDLEINDKDLKILGLKNDLVLCNVFNSFENNLNLKGVKKFNNLDLKISVDLDNRKKVDEYTLLREKRINTLKKNVHKNLGRYILFDETKNVYKEIYKLFRK